MHHKVAGWALLALISSSTILHTLAYPQHVPLISQVTITSSVRSPQYYSNSLPVAQHEQIAQERKFAEKPNALKNVALDDLDEIIGNHGTTVGPNKSNNLDTDSVSTSPWANLFSVGLRALTAILGGGEVSESIDKVDNGSPMHVTSNVRTHSPQYYSNSLPVVQHEQIAQERKFAEKPNALKKVALDDLDEIQTNSISDGGFSWSNVLGMLMQMIFNPGTTVGPNKSDNLDTDSVSTSPWANLFSVGLRLLTALLGGGGVSEGIDKVDNGSPMQSIIAAVLSTMTGAKDPDQVASMAKQAGEFINIVVNLLDALKTSFSHRSLTARSMGRKDSVSDAALAGIAMLKTYVRSFGTNDDKCLQKYVCDANTECSGDIGPKSVFCQFGTYAASFVLERQSGGTFGDFYEAGRRGRSGIDCRQMYLQCNEV